MLMRVYVPNCISRSNMHVFVHLYFENTGTDVDRKQFRDRAPLQILSKIDCDLHRNFQYSHDVNRVEDTGSYEINMNGRINDIDSVR